MSYYSGYSTFDTRSVFDHVVEFFKRPAVWWSLVAFLVLLVLLYTFGAFDPKVSGFAPEAMYSKVSFASATSDSDPLLDPSSEHAATPSGVSPILAVEQSAFADPTIAGNVPYTSLDVAYKS